MLTNGRVSIVVLQRGWVAVGYLKRNESQCVLEKTAIIRVWGTTKGLGEIAFAGPTKNTILDKCPDIHFHELTAVLIMDCIKEKWEDVLLL